MTKLANGSLRLGGTCAAGHVLTPTNVISNGSNQIRCKRCKREYDEKRRRSLGIPVLDRTSKIKWLKEHANVDTDDCIIWPFGTDDHGYGCLWRRGRVVRAHCVAYELFVDSSELHDVHHTCENKPCVNIRHLQKLTHATHAAVHNECRVRNDLGQFNS